MSDIALFRNTLRDLLRPKRLAAVAVVALLPTVVALLIRAAIHKGQVVPASVIYNMVAQIMVFGFVLVLLAVVFYSDVIAREVEQKTIVYLLTRPVPRWRILLMKFAATFVATTLAVWTALLILGVVTCGFSGLSGVPLGRDLLIAPVGVLAYGGLFLLLATVINRPMIYGLLFAFGWETWVPNLPGSFKMISLMTYVRTLAPHADPHGNLPTSDVTSHVAWLVLAGVIAVTVSGALAIFSVREYVPREDAE
jgi:ABC-2 type transport system permease protein